MRIDVGGYALNYELTGSGPETLTLTHGLASHLGTWKHQVSRLAQHYRVLTWDLRGHGKSDAPEGPWILADLSGDLFRLLNALSIPATHLLGHSAGGVVALHCALTYPHLVKRLFLVGTASEANERAAKWYEGLAQTAEQEGGEAVLKKVGLNEGAGALAPNGTGFAKAARCMGGLHRSPLTPRLKELTCPVMMIVGDRDFIGPGGSVILHRNIPGSRLEIVKDRGHGIYLEDPDSFNTLLLDFLKPDATEGLGNG